MLKNNDDRTHGRFSRWFHGTFDDWAFRYLLGPAQVAKAIDGAEPAAREGWKHDLDHRRHYTQDLHERKRLARDARAATDHSALPSNRSGTR
jgi:hypothetical protein